MRASKPAALMCQRPALPPAYPTLHILFRLAWKSRIQVGFAQSAALRSSCTASFCKAVPDTFRAVFSNCCIIFSIKSFLTERVPTQLRPNQLYIFLFTSRVGTCPGRGGWEHVAGVCVKILRSVVQRVLEQFCITFSPKMGAGGCPETLKSAPRWPSAAPDRIFIDF